MKHKHLSAMTLLLVPTLLSIVSLNVAGVIAWSSCIGFYWYAFIRGDV